MKILFAFVLALFAATLVTLPDAEARRFGGGMNLGKQYKSMPRTAPRQPQQAAARHPQNATEAARGNWGTMATSLEVMAKIMMLRYFNW